MPLLFPVIFPAFVLEDHDFGQAPLLDYGGLNFNAFHNRPANLQLISVREKDHLVEGDVFADFAGNLFHFDYMPGPGFILSPPDLKMAYIGSNPPGFYKYKASDKKSGL